MLAVLEDGMRTFLGTSRLLAREAEAWIDSGRQHWPFSFVVVCEILGLDPDAVRKSLKQMRSERVTARKALPRARRNVRSQGRVYTRKGG